MRGTHTHKWTTTQPEKKEQNGVLVVMWVDLETVIQSEVSQKEKNKYYIISLICGI